jgi:hypothetical protein|tara:strand:+ start:160 stop:303 length:144 start_codon:yes stop_codon:yes gene_type:complete
MVCDDPEFDALRYVRLPVSSPAASELEINALSADDSFKKVPETEKLA